MASQGDFRLTMGRVIQIEIVPVLGNYCSLSSEITSIRASIWLSAEEHIPFSE